MKLKKIASICGKRKMVEICHVGKEQYIGNEYALYLVPPDLKLTRENTLVVFDVAEKKKMIGLSIFLFRPSLIFPM